MEVHVFVADSEVPTRDRWQAHIDAASLPATLNDAFDPRSDHGFVQVTCGATDTGFEFALTESSLVTDAYPHASARVGGRDSCATFRWSGSMEELTASLAAAAALAEARVGRRAGHDTRSCCTRW
jgi:hypothetical protein